MALAGGVLRITHRCWRIILVLMAIALILTRDALAVTFTVFPISIILSAQSHSETLALHNHSDVPIRFQLSAFAWDQKPDGAMALTPTDDIIFFPQLLSLDPNQQRNIRVGSTVPPDEVEKTYRLFVQELAPTEKPKSQTPQVRVLTKMGIPVFIQPRILKTGGRVEDVSISGGILRFSLRNTGNVHLNVSTVRVDGFAGSSTPVFGREATGWYVLAGESRQFELHIARADCIRIRTIQVQINTDQTTYGTRYEVPADACAGADAGVPRQAAAPPRAGRGRPHS